MNVSPSIPKVSVIIPVYNCEKYVSQAIESVLSQTFQDFELLVIDDGSTDRSPAILKEYAQRYPLKINYLEHPDHRNCGVSATRNLGIRQSQGDYVAFLDADDLWENCKLQIQIDILETHQDVGFTYSPMMLIDEQGNPTRKMRGCYILGGGVYDTVHNMFDQLFLRTLTIGLGSTTLIRKSVLLEAGDFDTGLKYQCEDEILAGKITCLYPIWLSSQILTKYRMHDTNASRQWVVQNKTHLVNYYTMLRIYHGLKCLKQGTVDDHTLQIRLANLSWHACQRKTISRWSYYKLLLHLFPYSSVNLHILKIFVTLLLGHNLTAQLRGLFKPTVKGLPEK